MVLYCFLKGSKCQVKTDSVTTYAQKAKTIFHKFVLKSGLLVSL